jgi:hypothetical protein
MAQTQKGVGINTTSPKSTLDVNGSFGGRTTTITTNTTLDTAHFIVICDNPTDITLTLPSAAISGGRLYFIKRINMGRVFINPNGADSIDDTTAWVQLNPFQLTSIVGEGNTKWMVLNDGVPSAGGASGTGLTNADRRNAGTNTPAVMLSNFTGAVLDSLRIDVDTATATYAGLLTPHEKLLINSISDTATTLRTLIDNHITQDEDTDSTNEIQQLSISNDTLYISDGNMVFLGSISSDNDQDSTNELITDFSIVMDSISITDAGGTYALALSDIIDTTSLSNRINTNTQANIDSSNVLRSFIVLREAAIRSALVDSASAIRSDLDAHILADEDLDSTNELQMLSISNDTLYLSDGNNVYLGAISSDNDQDSTNEYNTAFEMNAGGDSLIITDQGTRFAVSAGDIMDTTSLSDRINSNTQTNIDSSNVLRSFMVLREAAIRSALLDSAGAIRTDLDAHILADEDLDSTNELQMLSISNDTLYLSDGNNVYLGAISSDNDQDSTNEYNTAFEMNAGGDSLIITDQGTRFAVSAGDIMDTTSLSDRINVNMQAIIDSSTRLNTAIIDTASVIRTLIDAHILIDEDTDSTNEYNTAFLVANDSLIIVDNGDSLKVSTKAIGPMGTTGSIFFVDTDGSPTENNSQLFWDASNNRLGIGTDNPSHKLQVVGQVRATNSANADGTKGSPAYRFHDDANTGMFSPAADQLAFTTGGNEAMRIDASQNVGVGDNITPTERMDVDGTIRLRNVDPTNLLDTVLVIDNTGVVMKTSVNDLGLIDSLVFKMDSLHLYASGSDYSAFIPDTDSTNEKIDTVYTMGDSIVIVEGLDTLYVDYNDKDWKLNSANTNSGLQGVPGGSTASGTHSIAAGLTNTASGASSSAVGGAFNLASGLNSTVSGGSSNTVSGISSTNSGGFSNTVSGFYSGNIGGTSNTVSGDKAAVIAGENNTAPSFGETVVGVNATSYTAADATAFDSTDKVFVVGNGSSTSARSNAMTVLKDGRVGIGVDGNANQTATLHIKSSTAINPLRVENVDTTSQADTVLVIESNGVVKKSSVFDASPIYAAGKVNANGTPASIKGATVSKIGGTNSGEYQITFTTALPNSNYIIQLSQISRRGAGNDDPAISYYDQQNGGFKVEIGDNDNGGTDRSNYDGEFMFTIIVF